MSLLLENKLTFYETPKLKVESPPVTPTRKAEFRYGLMESIQFF